MRVNSQSSVWGVPYTPEAFRKIHITAFERKCEYLGLKSLEDQINSIDLKKWVKKNMREHFVPEELLKAWGITVYIDSI